MEADRWMEENKEEKVEHEEVKEEEKEGMED